MTAPLASVCIPYRQRFREDRDLLSWVVGYWGETYPEWEVVVADMDWLPASLGDPTPPPFSRSAARNACARRAAGSVLIFANADTVPLAEPDDPLDAAVYAAADDPDAWDLSARYVEARAGWTREVVSLPPRALNDPPPVEETDRTLAAAPGQLGKPYAGLVVVSRDLHDRVGGWDERYGAGWGWEDTAYCDALAEAAGRGPARSGTVVHLWHDRRPEDSPSHPDARRNRRRWERENRTRSRHVRRRR